MSNEIQLVMINVATRKSQIQDEDDDYKKLYQDIDLQIELASEEGLAITNPNQFKSLWDWYRYWSSKNLNTSAREKYVYDLYLMITQSITDYLYTTAFNNDENGSLRNLEMPQFDILLKRIEEIQKIMIEVATKYPQAQIETIDEEVYTNIFKYIESQIIKLKVIGFPINNPNIFWSLSYWKSYYSCELQTYQSRRDYVSKLYTNIIVPINKSLKLARSRNNSLEEFIQNLKRYLIQAQSTQNINQISQHQNDTILVSNYPEDEASQYKNETQLLEPVSKLSIISNSREPISFTVPIAATQPTQSLPSDTVTDVVIITALEKERDAVLSYLDTPQEVQDVGKAYHRASIKTYKPDTTYQAVVICLECMGNVRSALATQGAITNFNPSHIILAGIAGGIPKDNRYLGDILVGEQIVYYELGKQIQSEQNTSQTQRRYETHRPAKLLLDAAKNVPHQNWVLSVKTPRPDGTTGRVIPNVHFGVVASGDKVIADPSLRDELQSDW
jgi:nucleoside phosphorylase